MPERNFNISFSRKVGPPGSDPLNQRWKLIATAYATPDDCTDYQYIAESAELVAVDEKKVRRIAEAVLRLIKD